MKIVSFLPFHYPGGSRLGAVYNNHIVDLAEAFRNYLLESGECGEETGFAISSTFIPGDTVQFLENGELSLDAALKGLAYVETIGPQKCGPNVIYNSNQIRMFSPLQRPRNLRDFMSFEQHYKNALAKKGKEVPQIFYEIPAYYKGSTSTIIGHEEDLIMPDETQKLDYELEFACIIGKQGKDVKQEDAEDHIFGYMIMNDFSARDIQGKEMQLGLGPAKSKDFGTALGPYLITKDEIPDPYNLKMIGRVNGEVWSEGNSSTMIRSFPQLIEYASKDERIVPGDVFGSGTVGFGCGLELDKYLNHGDVVELEIEGLGILKNRVVKKLNGHAYL